MFKEVIGRSAELAALEAFLDGLVGGVSAAVLEGEAGIGKTTLWTSCIAHAEGQGKRALVARPAESETALSYSGIRDLLDAACDEALAPLPAPQRRALSRALVLDDDEGPAPDPHAIGVGLLTALRELAAMRPLLLAVDDVQWLDPESSAALAFAFRRLHDAPAGVLVTRRAGLESGLLAELCRALPPGRYQELELGPLGVEALHHVVQHQLGLTLPPPLLAEVHAASGGNPFYALELVRTLRRRGDYVEAGQLLPVPESLHELVHGRLLALPPETRDYLLAAAAQSHPTGALVEAVTHVAAEHGLVPAVEAGVVELDGDRIRFTHPLLAAGAYELAEPARRAEVHARLAELVDDPEARGRHLAVSVREPDTAVAAALEDAAGRALARGAPRAAALLLERSFELTPPADAASAGRRALDAASAHHEAGDRDRARALLDAELEHRPAGPQRAEALAVLARVRSYDDDLRGAAGLYQQAMSEADPASAVEAFALAGLSATLLRLRERVGEAAELSRRAAESATLHRAPQLAAEALATAAVCEALLGLPRAHTTVGEALALEPHCADRAIVRQPRFAAAVVRFWHDDLVGARRAFEEMAGVAAELGDESSIPYVRVMLGQIDCVLGRFHDAVGQAEAGRTIAEQAGQRTLMGNLLAVRAVAEAHLGRADEARSSASRALELAESTSGVPAWISASWALGHLALALGDPSGALERLSPLLAHHRREAIEEPGALPFLPDCVDGLLEAGRVAEAEDALDWYQAAAERLGRESGLAAARRGRGLLAAARGELPIALDELEAAVELTAAGEMPFALARAQLAYGAALSRALRRREARDTLQQALDAFDELGTALWADRARAELRRISGRAPTAGGLTPAEERVAALVAQGKTNREVAAALFLSERTVEGHLTRVFEKLGVRSRTELARVLSRPVEGVPTPNTGDSPVSATPPSS